MLAEESEATYAFLLTRDEGCRISGLQPSGRLPKQSSINSTMLRSKRRVLGRKNSVSHAERIPSDRQTPPSPNGGNQKRSSRDWYA